MTRSPAKLQVLRSGVADDAEETARPVAPVDGVGADDGRLAHPAMHGKRQQRVHGHHATEAALLGFACDLLEAPAETTGMLSAGVTEAALLLMRGATGLQMHQPERFADYGRAVYQAMWVDGRDMNDPAVVAEVLAAASLDPAALVALAGRQDVKDRLKAVTTEAVERGVFGAPTMFVGDEMFWGQDRLDFVREALQHGG